MTDTKSEIRALIEGQFDAIGAKNVNRLMSFYSPDVVYFDVVPPLQFVGADALRRRFTEWLGGFQGAVSAEFRDLRMLAGTDMAVAYLFSRVSGTMKNGRVARSWVRVTTVCQNIDRRWLVTHEHVSWPVDPASGKAVLED